MSVLTSLPWPLLPLLFVLFFLPQGRESPSPGGKDPLKMQIWVITASPESLARARHYDACQIHKNPTKRMCY